MRIAGQAGAVLGAQDAGSHGVLESKRAADGPHESAVLSLFAIAPGGRDEIVAVITDAMMPVMDGAVLIRTLRTLDADVKIICVSGLASEHKLAQIEKSQVRRFISKPFTRATLLTTLREVITSN